MSPAIVACPAPEAAAALELSPLVMLATATPLKSATMRTSGPSPLGTDELVPALSLKSEAMLCPEVQGLEGAELLRPEGAELYMSAKVRTRTSVATPLDCNDAFMGAPVLPGLRAPDAALEFLPVWLDGANLECLRSIPSC